MNINIVDKSPQTPSGFTLAAALSGAVFLAGCATTGSSNLGEAMDSSQLEKLFAQPLSGTYVT